MFSAKMLTRHGCAAGSGIEATLTSSNPVCDAQSAIRGKMDNRPAANCRQQAPPLCVL